MPSYLKQTRSGVYFRVRVPDAIADVIECEELIVPVQARSRRDARLRAAALAHNANTLFRRLTHRDLETDDTAIREAITSWLDEAWREIEDDHLMRERPYPEHEHER